MKTRTSLNSERADLLGCMGRQISNPQPDPQKMMSCTTCRYFGSPRVVVSCCKTYPGKTVTAEVASSSLVVPAITLNGLQRTPKNNLDRSVPVSISASAELDEYRLLTYLPKRLKIPPEKNAPAISQATFPHSAGS